MTAAQLEFPTLTGLESLLHMHRGRTAYVIPMTDARGRALGNNGDRLMISVFRRVLDYLGIRTSEDPRTAELVVVPPNGALLEAYQFPTLLAARLEPFRDIPVVIFPSSALFNTTNPAFIFQGRTAPTTWILREKNSLGHLVERWGGPLRDTGVELVLDHDIVASGHEYVREIVPGPLSERSILVGARVDREAKPFSSGVSGAVQLSATASSLHALASKVPYGPWLTAAVRAARRDKQNSAAEALLASLPEDLAEEIAGARGRYVRSDVSATQYATFAEYGRELRRSTLVVTNRLHVALPAAILGKRVILVEAGYHKLSGVYQQSLTSVSNVSLVNRQR